MPWYEFEGRRPRVDPTAFVSETAILVGQVHIGPRVYVGHGAILRADYGNIVVDAESAVEEGAIVHINPGGTCHLAERVTVGHGAKVHCPRLEASCVVGIGAVLSFDVIVGEWAIVAEGAVVPNGTRVPPGVIVAGNPAREIGRVGDRHRSFWIYGKDLYVDLTRRYARGFRRLR